MRCTADDLQRGAPSFRYVLGRLPHARGRVLAAEELAEPAQRSDKVDLERAWQERSTRFRAGGDQVTVLVRVESTRREELVGTALAVRAEVADGDGWLRLEVTFPDARHAEWALW